MNVKPSPFLLSNELPARAFSRWPSIAALEAFGVEAQALVAREVFDEVARQAVGVVELERLVAGEHAGRLRGALEHLFEPRQPAGQHGVEPLFLAVTTWTMASRLAFSSG